MEGKTDRVADRSSSKWSDKAGEEGFITFNPGPRLPTQASCPEPFTGLFDDKHHRHPYQQKAYTASWSSRSAEIVFVNHVYTDLELTQLLEAQRMRDTVR